MVPTFTSRPIDGGGAQLFPCSRGHGYAAGFRPVGGEAAHPLPPERRTHPLAPAPQDQPARVALGARPRTAGHRPRRATAGSDDDHRSALHGPEDAARSCQLGWHDLVPLPTVHVAPGVSPDLTGSVR